MNKFLWQRRQLLVYLGLGLAGAGSSKVFGISVKRENLNPIPVPEAKGLTEIAISSPAGKPLPEFQGISQWLNSQPLTISNLKGNVVLVQFWTLGCINCQRTLPYIVRWHRQYAAKGLKIIGIHTPEFAYERDTNNIKQALLKHQITYPVAIDNDYKTWNAYSNGYWPHLFLADRQGLLRYDHVGEGEYDTTEQTIRKLLGEKQ